MTRAMQYALRAVQTMAAQDEFTELHEVAFAMRDEIIREGMRAPSNLEQAKMFVRARMEGESNMLTERVAEILLAATYRRAK